MESVKIVMGQLNLLVGDIPGNAALILEKAHEAKEKLGADMIVFPELALTSYPVDDLLLRDDFYHCVRTSIEKIKQSMPVEIALVFGFPEKKNHYIYNRAVCFYQHHLLAASTKQKLPNSKVFDEKRYFTPHHETCTFDFKGIRFGILICEDIWYPEPIEQAKQQGAECILSINASPFSITKAKTREDLLSVHVHHHRLPIIYVNLIGGQDELVFDGGSFAINNDGTIAAQAPYFKPAALPVVLTKYASENVVIESQMIPDPLTEHEKIYQALMLGLSDYIHKNEIHGVLLGLSGGIDSALTCAIAVDALGAENVTAVLMPSQYTAEMSIKDAEKQAKAQNINYHILSIQSIVNTVRQTLSPIFYHDDITVVEENIQARARGILLTALSNQTGLMIVNSSNKSETAVGYATLYGDMCGGLSILKDVSKTLIYELAQYRNTISPVIPERVLTRAPSAELRENQKDADTLPPYHTMDAVIQQYIEEDNSIEDICNSGFERSIVEKIISLIRQNEYKRRQSPLGIRITARAFGKDRRYPITVKYNFD
jgi:NAD+ synthase (glutamine-hydrolysing)